MSLKVSVTRNHNFSSGLVTRAALNAGATPTVSITGSVDTAEIADSAITNAKVASDAAISFSKLGDLDAGHILTGGGDYPVSTSLLSSTTFGDSHHVVSSPSSTYKGQILLGNNTTTNTVVMSGDAELVSTGALHINPAFVTGKSSLGSGDIADADTLLVVDDSETPDKYKKITFANLKTAIDTTSNAASDSSAGVAELATYGEVFTGTDSTRIITANNLKAHPAVPIAWARFTGTEDDANHTNRRSASDASEDPNIVTNYNITGINKTDVGTYTVTITNCPSSSIMVVGDIYSWGTNVSGQNDYNEQYQNLNLEIISTSGGESSSGSSATIQFKTRIFNDHTETNFREARLVFYAK
jgi:hypothetical protein